MPPWDADPRVPLDATEGIAVRAMLSDFHREGRSAQSTTLPRLDGTEIEIREAPRHSFLACGAPGPPPRLYVRAVICCWVDEEGTERCDVRRTPRRPLRRAPRMPVPKQP